MSEALVRETGTLRGHSWSAGAERPVADLVEDLETAQEEWALAAKATDADTYYAHLDKGFALIEADTTVTARKALGLDSTPPVYEEGGDGGGESPGKEV
jgi:phosphohistidine swiveling domain-containing protein